MNLPNKLTVFRVILIIPFVIILLGGYAQWGWLSAIMGVAMKYTDYIKHDPIMSEADEIKMKPKQNITVSLIRPNLKAVRLILKSLQMQTAKK